MFRLSVIADRGIFASHGAWLAAIDRAARVTDDLDGVALQVRLKGFENEERTRLIERAGEVLGPRAARAFLNGSIEEARRHGFRGAHLPEADIPETLQPSPLTVGASIHSPGALERAVAASVQYVQFGPVFDAGSKPVAGVGLGALARIARTSPVPVVAVGGITPENAVSCFEAGASAVAVVTGVFHAPDIESAIHSYLAACHAAAAQPATA